MKDREKYYGLYELKELGFTKSLMDKYLPSEDLQIDNPYYKCAAPMRFWLKDKIDTLTAENPVRNELDKVLKNRSARSLGARKAVATKTTKTVQYAEEMGSKLKILNNLSLKEVRKAALNSKQAWYDSLDNYDCLSTYGADEDTINRWTVNYIRHEMTNYEYCLSELMGKVGKDTAYYVLRKPIFELIKSTYPELAKECDLQSGCFSNTINPKEGGNDE